MSETKSGIGGKKRETQDFGKIVGLAEFKVLVINPTREQFKSILGRDLDENSKADQYLGEKDGNKTLRIDVWGELVKNKRKEKITLFLEDKERSNKDNTKNQYINSQGSTTWSDSEENLKGWFTKHDFRIAKGGEEELYGFMRAWLGKLDFQDADTVLNLDWKKLMKGNVSEISSQLNGEYDTTFIVPFTVKRTDKDGETKEYQSVYNKGFLPSYTLKFFRLNDFSKDEVLENLKRKEKPTFVEKFVLQITDSEFGCKDSYLLKDFKDYNPDDFLVASNKTLQEDNQDY